MEIQLFKCLTPTKFNSNLEFLQTPCLHDQNTMFSTPKPIVYNRNSYRL